MIAEFAEGDGKSFKGLATYLLHDPDKAKTDQRVPWTHTLNLASDHPSLAVDEMLWTYRGADYLKREAGIKAGGRKLEHPVKHFSLNWHPTEKPSKTHMIETVEGFLKHMGWSEHQALLVAHNDKPHAHVHVMLNVVHPETGKALNAGFEKRRAGDWAYRYELERGRVFCEQRSKPFFERERAPTRQAWTRMKESQHTYDTAEYQRLVKGFDYFQRNDAEGGEAKVKEAFKAHQRQQRDQFFIDGKKVFRQTRDAVFHEVRREFRPAWREYYQAKRNGKDAGDLSAMKEKLLKEQNAMLDDWRKIAMDNLKAQRDIEYKALLKQQDNDRKEFAKTAVHSYEVIDQLRPTAPAPKRKEPEKQPYASKTSEYHLGQFAENKASFSEKARDESEEKAGAAERDDEKTPETPSDRKGNEHFRVKDGLDAVSGIGMGALGAVAKIGERLMDSFFGNDVSGKARTPQNSSAPPKRAMSDEERERARRAGEAKAEAEAQVAEAAALVADWEYRRQRRRERGRD
ncbi:MAG TPA: relaxase/mobilization nuclease domain-containing protein [Stellaceae bacterium]|jgi:hypothetical protein|nr:relaxase/mobilization nuclease domain-containing protein [Stellaceae bacterium]